ncbi:hypothetical protein F4861DRAFT_398568 [Xylaria intraflava]|nr:hypothetical protein F4861DRAFT_398568 [Xylaria intraflava]
MEGLDAFCRGAVYFVLWLLVLVTSDSRRLHSYWCGRWYFVGLHVFFLGLALLLGVDAMRLGTEARDGTGLVGCEVAGRGALFLSLAFSVSTWSHLKAACSHLKKAGKTIVDLLIRG